MASYSGTISEDILYPDTVPFCSATIINDSPLYAYTVFNIDEVTLNITCDSSYSNLPVEQPCFEHTGLKVRTFVDDYYYRVHVTPATLAFGPVLSELVDTFIVWNAWFDAINCTLITETGGDEFELSGSEDPYELKALEYTTYTVTIPKEGSADISSSIEFTFITGEERTVIITGIRMIVFYFPPQVTIKESYEWATDVMAARDGGEQRMSFRQIPRQGFVFDVPLPTSKIQNRFNAAMHGWSKRYFGCPVWAEKVLHTSDINATDMSITVDTTFADFRDESYALVFKDIDHFEAVKIDTKNDTTLTLESAVVATYTGNKWIIPLRIAQVSGMTKQSNPVAEVGFAQISFAVKDNILITGFSADQTYLGLPVLLVASKQLNASPKESSIDSDSFLQDYESGDFDYYSDSDFNLNIQGWGFFNDTKEAMWVYKQFLHSLLGQQGTIWIPTFKNDMELADTIGAADTSFQIENIKLAENMGLNDLRTHLAFIFPGGTVLCRQITGIVESDEDIEIISIDSDLGLEVEAGDCQICFLDKCRLASDMVAIEHIIAYKNYSNVAFLSVKE